MRYAELERIIDRDGVTSYVKYRPESGHDVWDALVGVIADIAVNDQIVIEYRAITSMLFEVTTTFNPSAAKRIMRQFAAYRSIIPDVIEDSDKN